VSWIVIHKEGIMESWAFILFLRLVHVVAGMFWVGAAVFVAVYLLPSVIASGPAGGTVMREITQARRLPVAMQWATWLTLVSGVLLYWRISGGFHPAWLASGPGITFGAGGVLAIVAAAIGIVVSAPTAQRMSELGARITAAGGPPTPEHLAEMALLQGRMKAAAGVGALLLLAATAAMAVARFM
jgi:uncharacterized membrane protein